jgi:putative endonuclease
MNSTSAFEKGIQAEQWAKEYLTHEGYLFLAQRYKTKFGEVDLIMALGNCLTFFEVKRRANVTKGLWCLNPKTHQRLWNTGLHFLQHHPKEPTWDSMQFDLVLVFPDMSLSHIKNILSADSGQDH